MLCNSCGNVLESFNKFCPKCGAPAPAQYQPPSPSPGPPPYNSAQTPGGWGPMPPPPRKSSCGKVVLIVGIILVVLGLGAAGAIYYGFRYAESALKSSEAYQTAVTALKESPEVREKLGEITDTGFPLGAFNQNSDGSGNAEFSMSVKGSKETGQYSVELRRRNSIWKVRNGSVRLPNGDTIQVVDNDMNEDLPENFNSNSNTNLNTNTPENLSPGKTISGGVLNAKATSLPKPAYPSVARAAKATGTVVVKVLVNEQGDVVSATAISGHPLLRAAAEAAARQAKFTPTKLSGKPVKVSGVLNYNFVEE
jgi:TonB family protein